MASSLITSTQTAVLMAGPFGVNKILKVYIISVLTLNESGMCDTVNPSAVKQQSSAGTSTSRSPLVRPPPTKISHGTAAFLTGRIKIKSRYQFKDSDSEFVVYSVFGIFAYLTVLK